MGNTREWTREFNARRSELTDFVKAKAGRSEKARKNAIRVAASGRSADLPEVARASVANRRAIAMVERLQGGAQ
jgi:formylglycine-generating enzyme required for sulfatase activity